MKICKTYGKLQPHLMTKERLGWEVFSKGLGRRQGGKLPISQTMHVNVAFKELVHRILEKIKQESFFHWLGKMSKDLTRRNQHLY